MQIGGYLIFALVIIHAGRVIAETLAERGSGGHGILGWMNSGLTGMVHASPFLFFAGGLIAVAKLGALYGQRIIFAEENARLIRRFGDALAWTTAAMLLLRPTVLGWIEGSSYGLTFKITEGGLVTFVTALFVSLMAKVMQKATQLEHENKQFI